MKYEPYRASLLLTGEAIDRVSEQIEGFLRGLKSERANVFRIRLSLEEALLRWQDHFGDEAAFSCFIGMRRGRPIITLELTGEAYDPLSRSENDLGAWSDTLLSGIGITPNYSYNRGVNIVQLKLHKHRSNPALSLLAATVIGVTVGTMGMAAFPPALRLTMVTTVLGPIQTAFFRILNAIAGPVIFFSVLNVVCGVGNVATMGKSGKLLIRRFLLLSSVITLLSTAVAAPFFQLTQTEMTVNRSLFSHLLDFLLRMVPSDVLTPFSQGDSPQLIMLAIVLGNAMLVLGSQAEGLVSLADQANAIGLLIADWVSGLTPAFVTLLLILGIWDNALMPLLGIWKPLLIFTVLSMAALGVSLLRVCFSVKVAPMTLIRKMKRSFLLAFRTASVNEAYGENQICCVRKLGISEELANYGLPLGLVIYMPAGIMCTMILTLYAAQCSDVPVSIGWYMVGVFLTVALQTASPPVSGVNLLAYAAIFAHQGIPSSSLTIAMVADILFCFLSSAVNQAMLQLELVLEADRMELLNHTLLQKKKKSKQQQ